MTLVEVPDYLLRLQYQTWELKKAMAMEQIVSDLDRDAEGDEVKLVGGSAGL